MHPALRFLAAALFLPAAHAHTPGATERIEVTEHYEAQTGETASASEGAVTQRLIENRPVLRPAEVLEFVPGVVITQHSGDGKANQYFLRGFNLDHGTDFATWVAGMPVNMPTHAHGQGYSDLNFLIPEVVRRIDYLKGPYFAREGDFSSAGAARISLTDHMRSDIAGVTLGPHNYTRGVVAASPELAGGTMLMALEGATNDGPWVNPERFRKVNALARYSRGGENAWSVTAMAYTSKWNATDQIPLRAVQSGALGRFGAIDPTDGGDTSRYSVSFEGRATRESSQLDVSAYVIRSQLDLFSNFTYFLDRPDTGDQFEQSEHRSVAGGAVSQRWFHRAFGADMSSTIGLQARYDRLDPVGLRQTVERERIATTREDQVKQSTGGIYFENGARWTKWVRTLLGVRYDRYRFDVESDNPLNSGTSTSGIVSPKASVALGDWNGIEAFANWGRGFHSNDARGTTITIDPATGEPAQRVTALVRSTGSEVGFRAEPVPGFKTALALWQLRLDSELVFAGDAGTTEAGRPSLRKGIEWTNHYVVNPNLLIDFDLAASRARFTGDDPAGDRIPGALERVVSAGVSLVDMGPWSAGLHVRYFGPRPLIEDNSVRSESTTLVTARVGYRLSPAWRLSFDVFNLLDRKASDIDYFYTSRLRGEPAAGVDDIHFHPVEPRTLRVTLTASF